MGPDRGIRLRDLERRGFPVSGSAVDLWNELFVGFNGVLVRVFLFLLRFFDGFLVPVGKKRGFLGPREGWGMFCLKLAGECGQDFLRVVRFFPVAAKIF